MEKGGAYSHGTQCQTQAHVAVCRDERRKMAVGGCGQCPGGLRLVTGELVGSGCKREGVLQQTLLIGESLE